MSPGITTKKKKAPLKQFRRGRVCRKRGCKKLLSIYNPEPYCHVHHREFLDQLEKKEREI